MVGDYPGLGWQVFDTDPELAPWIAAAAPAARAALQDPAKADWRCGGTWFAGVNALENDGTGAVAGSGTLRGEAVRFIAAELGARPVWDRAQLSTLRPGYPQPDPGESAAAAQYRRNRDAAHVDGLLPIGPNRARMLREPHAFILGLPLSLCSADAAPLVVWEGSHQVMRAAFEAVLAPHDPSLWPEIDLTETYHAARRHCFAQCPRLTLPARPGQAILVHRLTLHGVAPWAETATAPPEGRIIAYFRPEFPRMQDWLWQP